MLLRRLAKWDMILAPFDIKFMPQKAVKGQAITNFLAAYLCTENEDYPMICQTMKLCLLKLKLGNYILMGRQGVRESE